MKFDVNTLNKYVEETIVCCEKHPNADLYIYGYYSSTDKPTVWDEISIHCRGMIVNGQGEVMEHPFTKFWTYKQYLNKYTVLLNDNQIFKIPKGNFRILEKIDGTMCTLYWIGEKPYLATQRSFTNPKAIEATKILYEKHSDVIGKLNKNYTYIFEAVYLESDVLIDYGNTRDIFLIGMIDKVTGMPIELPDLGFPKARDFTKKYGHIRDFDELAALNLPNQEGFVLYFENGQMMKLKFPWYLEAHKSLDRMVAGDFKLYRNQLLLKQQLGLKEHYICNLDIWKALKNGDQELHSITSQIPSYYYLMSFEYWLKKTEKRLKKDFSQKKDWNLCKPKVVDIFNIDDRMDKAHIYESTVWNWKKRYLK
ncbi:RNA ligase [Segatella bryantii]|uniref:hypothetical protein n=1 Tax=Segatella bryantii TaxID=77095 RepID=UPI000899476E|nr:hypothetical protein [Segatella bryantii]UKK74763.1 T4 RnlA family RNA ligase [Segatella bryantii]SEA10158.1 RNA ligase [Segatella bryantii]